MKKRKFKLLASLTSLVLVVAVMAVGVWAAVQHNVTITSNVGFTANGISGVLTAGVTGTTGAGVYDQDGSDTFSITDDLFGTWAIGSIVFVPDETTGIPTDIVYTVTIENTGSEAIAVSLLLPRGGDPIADLAIGINDNLTAVYKTSSNTTTTSLTAPNQNDDETVYIGGGESSWGTLFTGVVGAFNIAASATGGFAVVLHVNNYAQSITALDINFNVHLEKA